MKPIYINSDQRDGITFAIGTSMFINCLVLTFIGTDGNNVPIINALWWNLFVISVVLFRICTSNDRPEPVIQKVYDLDDLREINRSNWNHTTSRYYKDQDT